MQLRCGHDFGHGGWGSSPSDEDRAEMAVVWAEYGEQLTAEYRERRSLTMPWGWWQFSAPEPRDATKPEWYVYRNRNHPGDIDYADEWYQLLRLGVLAEDFVREQTAGYVRIHVANQNEHQGYRVFRRPLAWWLWHSPAPRDPAKCELAQLVAMKVLLDREQKILDGDRNSMRDFTARHDSKPDTWLKFLRDEERRLIGLPPVRQPAPALEQTL
jgi:hypothetical protein